MVLERFSMVLQLSKVAKLAQSVFVFNAVLLQ